MTCGCDAAGSRNTTKLSVKQLHDGVKAAVVPGFPLGCGESYNDPQATGFMSTLNGHPLSDTLNAVNDAFPSEALGFRRDGEPPHRGVLYVTLFAGVLLTLPIKRLVVGVLLHQDHRQQARSGKSAGNRIKIGKLAHFVRWAVPRVQGIVENDLALGQRANDRLPGLMADLVSEREVEPRKPCSVLLAAVAIPTAVAIPKAVFAAAAPINRDHRADFLHVVVDMFPGRDTVGDGELHRAIVEAQRRYFDPPLDTGHGATPLRRDKLRRSAGA
jgi:hypothetical protein